MQKIALYRKYRPENFDQIVGQDHIVQVLSNAVTAGKISHAYLFSGPRGTGKTSMARILAKAANCQKRKGANPCGGCSSCTGIAEGRLIDLIEIDAASNRGIDEIRDLREKVRFTPTEVQYKVFIIDEVHMLTKEAFNALLKTLEEPPEHAIFILATTEINKIPGTIISRCQRHDFRRIKLSDIVAKLDGIRKAEKIKIDDDALELVAEASEGGLRDAISLLDQLSGVGLAKIGEGDVEDILGLSPFATTSNLIDALISKDKGVAVKILEKALADGIDPVNFTKSLSDYARKLITMKLAGPEIVEGTKEQIETLKEQSEKGNIELFLELSDQLIWAQGAFRTNTDPRFILLVVLAQICDAEEKLTPVAETHDVPKAPKEAPAQKTKIFNANGKWQHFLLEIKSKNHTIHAFLRVASPDLSDGKLTLTFPYKFHKERIEESKNKRMVEEVLEKVYGEPIVLVCELDGGGKTTNRKAEDAESAASILGGEVVD